ncbi:unnamed protein product [Sympodiomycopsis kandeliae]
MTSANVPPSVRNLILDLLQKSDLASVTPRKLRTDLESVQSAQKLAPPADDSRHVPADFDLEANKKAVNAVIKECYDIVAGTDNGSQEDVKPAINDSSAPSSQSTPAPGLARSPPPPKTTVPLVGGLALPGLGGVRGSHASPPPVKPLSNGNSTAGDAALAAKLQQKEQARDSPATRGSSSSSSSSRPAASKKRKSQAADPDEIQSDEDSDVEAAAAAVAAKSRTKKSRKSTTEKEKKPRASNPNNPFNRPVLLSPAMAEICGGDEMPRHGVVKQLWAYVKERDLQNPENKRQIMCDDKLQQLFGKPMVDSFEMSKLIGSHLKKKEDVVS